MSIDKRKVILTWRISITIAKKTFVTSVKKLTLIGLKLNFPSTLDIQTRIGCQLKRNNLCQLQNNKHKTRKSYQINSRELFNVHQTIRLANVEKQICKSVKMNYAHEAIFLGFVICFITAITASLSYYSQRQSLSQFLSTSLLKPWNPAA